MRDAVNRVCAVFETSATLRDATPGVVVAEAEDMVWIGFR